MENEPIDWEIGNYFYAIILFNNGNHAKVGVLNRLTKKGEFTTRTRPIADEKEIVENVYDELFNFCPKNGFIVLELAEQGKDKIVNYLGTDLPYQIEKKQIIPKRSFFKDFMKYIKTVEKPEH